MKLTTKQIKQRHFNKVYTNSKIIKCACGCEKELKSKNKYGRDVRFINGHNNRKYKDPKQYQKEWSKRNKKSIYITRIKRSHKLKVKVIKLLGGKCINCGLIYNGKNACVFQMHHRDPLKKEIAVNTRTLVYYAWSKILKEMKKCDLLCANCHFTKHNKKY